MGSAYSMSKRRMNKSINQSISLFTFIDAVNEHVEAEKYAIVRVRIKTSKKNCKKMRF